VSTTVSQPLTVAGIGHEVRVCSLQGGHCQRQRLRELGLCEGRTLRVVTNSDPLICQVGDGRFGLCRRLARSIWVEPV
jgi:Fe2+ transport system protein FeoA